MEQEFNKAEDRSAVHPTSAWLKRDAMRGCRLMSISFPSARLLFNF